MPIEIYRQSWVFQGEGFPPDVGPGLLLVVEDNGLHIAFINGVSKPMQYTYGTLLKNNHKIQNKYTAE